MLREAVADSDFDVNEVRLSIHRTGINESNGDWDEDIVIGTGGVSGCFRSTIDSP